MSIPKKTLPPSFHLVLVFTLGLLFWGYWPQWVSLWQTWQSDPDYNHGFLVVPISVWLLWQRRAGLGSIKITPSWWGIVLILVAALLSWAGAEFFIPQIETWSIPVWVAGVVLLFGGWSVLRWSGGAIAFLWFMTPLPDSMIGFVSLPLQKCSAALSTWTLHLFAQPAVRFGTTISLGEHVLEVERACSGLRICYGIMALAVAYVVLTRPRPLRVIILLALALPVAILANSARVTGTGLLFLVVSGEEAHQYAHDFSGLLMMPFAIFLFWLAHMAMEKIIGAFERSARAGNMLVLKSGLAVLIVATGLVLWQRRQADAAVGTLLKIAEGHETEGQRLQDDKKPVEAVQEWVQAIGVLDRYCRVRPDDAQAALRLAKVAEQLARTNAMQIRAARAYERAWSLMPDDNELGLKQARLALAGEDFQMAVGAAEKLSLKTDSGSPEHLEAFRIKIQAQLQDAGRSNPKTTWTQVAESLQQGIDGGLEVVSSSYQLALLYREHPLPSIDDTQRDVAAEQVMSALLSRRPEDPMAWFARFAFHQKYPAPEVIPTPNDTNPDAGVSADSEPAPLTNPDENKTPGVGAPLQTPDADLDRAVELATREINSDTHPLWLAAGGREISRKEFEKARQYFRNAIQALPTHDLAYLQLARLESTQNINGKTSKEVKLQQREAAIKVLKEGLSREELKDTLILRVELIRQQLQTTDATNIAEANQELLELKSEFKTFTPAVGVPLQLELTLIESQIYADAGDFEKAAKLLDPVLNSNDVLEMKAGSGLLSSAWIALGGYYEQLGLKEKADSCFLQAQTREPDSIPNDLFEGSQREREGDSRGAADLFEDIAARLGNRPEPWLAMARNELRQQLAKASSQQNFERLKSALQRAVGLGAPEADTAAMYSEIATAEGDLKQAITVLETAASRNPDSAILWQMLAVRRQVSGDVAGSQAALDRYREIVGDPLRTVLLESSLMIAARDLDNARRVLMAAMTPTLELEDQRSLLEQLVRVELLSNQQDAAQQRLQKFAEEHPKDIRIRVQLANMYFGQGRLDLMEQTEQQIKELEGESGASFLTLRARRLLQLAGRTQVAQERGKILAEVARLLDSLPPHRPETRELQGQLKLQAGRRADAAGHFEEAWNKGNRSPRLAAELIFALRASGDTTKSEHYLEQMQDMLPASPQLFDLALEARSSTILSDLNRSLEIVNNWVRSINDAAAYLRLARTLRLKNVTSGPKRDQWLQETELAYRKAIELGPTNPEPWGEFLNFLNNDRNERSRTVTVLNEFARNREIPEVDRSFVTSVILTGLNLQQQAARSWASTIEFAQQAADQRAQNRVFILAAQFFAGRDTAQAISLARRAVASNPDDVTGLRLLIALLSDTNSITSLKEASTLLDSLPEVREWLNNPLATDSDDLIDRISVPDKRIIASVLYRRAVLLPSEFNASDDLLRAAQLLQSLENLFTEADSVQLARIIGAQGDKQRALIELSGHAGRTGASVATVRAFVEYWQDNFAGTETLVDHVQQALQTLEDPSGSPITALDLRLRPSGIDSDAVNDILQQFVTGVIASAPTVELQDQLLQQTFALLARKDLSAVSLHLLQDESPPLTMARKLKALVLVSIQTPGAPDFEASLTRILETELPVAKSAELNRTAADYYFMRADWKSAEQCYRRCLEQDPSDVGAANNLALVIAEVRSDFDEADRLIQQSLTSIEKSDSSPVDQSVLRDTQAQLLLAAGKTEAALEILTALSQSVTADASVFLHLAECYHKLGRTDESGKAFVIAEQLGIASSLLPPMDKRIYDNLATSSTTQAGVENETSNRSARIHLSSPPNRQRCEVFFRRVFKRFVEVPSPLARGEGGRQAE